MRIFKHLFIALLATVATTAHAQTTDYTPFQKKFNIYVGNDLGRNGYYDQKPIAELMGEMANEIGPEFVIATGDIFHYQGVQSTTDPLWMTNYELIYQHPELMIDWYPVLGNHEYQGNTQAVIDYTAVSRRWNMPDRYYTKVFNHKGNTSIRVVWLDTAPLITKYRDVNGKYPDAAKQDMDVQLAWVDSVLTASNEDWVIVAGHHPVYAQTPKDPSERVELQERLNPILEKHGVDLYVAGHIHNFQHIRMPNGKVDHVVNSSGSLARKVSSIEGTQFCSPEPGFSVISIDNKELNLHMIDKEGNIIYTMKRTKK